MTDYSFGEIILVPFPFTDQSAVKKRPAVIISAATYNQRRPDLIIMAVTSQAHPSSSFGEIPISRWKESGLLRPSIIKPIVTTIEKRLVLKSLGHLSGTDLTALKDGLQTILGC